MKVRRDDPGGRRPRGGSAAGDGERRAGEHEDQRDPLPRAAGLDGESLHAVLLGNRVLRSMPDLCKWQLVYSVQTRSFEKLKPGMMVGESWRFRCALKMKA